MSSLLTFNMMVVALVSMYVALATASDYKDYRDTSKKDSKEDKDAYKAYIYQGKYPGKCGKDGIYYMDEKSFVFCSNGNSYTQPCAPGSRNSPYQTYSYGGKYDYRDFCDVNLVDEGYSARKALYSHYPKLPYVNYGYGGRDVVYGRANYGYDLSYGQPQGYRGYGGRGHVIYWDHGHVIYWDSVSTDCNKAVFSINWTNYLLFLSNDLHYVFVARYL